MNELNVTWMFPSILNLHGDRGNILALERIGKLLGIKVNVTKIEDYNEEINFKNTDILFFNPGEIKVMKPIAEYLKKQNEELDKYINSNKFIILIAQSGIIMSKNMGLGYLDMECIERKEVYGDDIYFTTNDEQKFEIVGCQIQLIDTKLNSSCALGNLNYGMGNRGFKEGNEGAKYKNVIFTNTLGPVLVKNPWYTEHIIKEAMKQKGISIETSIDEKEFEIELKSMECIKKFIDQKKKVEG